MSAHFICSKLFREHARTRTRPYATVKVAAENGKFALESFLKQERLENVFLWQGEDVIQLLIDHHGFTTTTFNHSETYCLKTKATKSYDRVETFSSVTMATVIGDFNLEMETDTWELPHEDFSLPPEPTRTFALMSNMRTLRAENWHTIIELYLLYAMEAADGHPLTILHDELTISILREINREDMLLERVSYTGTLAFVVGHSAKGNEIPKDTPLLAVEAKRSATFEKALAQAIAQASSMLCLRREKKRAHGDYRTYWICSDGERWVMGFVRPDGDSIKYGHTSTHSSQITKRFKENTCAKIYSMLGVLDRDAQPSTFGRNSFSNSLASPSSIFSTGSSSLSDSSSSPSSSDPEQGSVFPDSLRCLLDQIPSVL
ncbi:hypothetical protein BC832DRAFT_320887 [Gaertneriomyces semiglobifer]|nr:hypothetical protein BC832DRAFT_320887 [Gaertneriomyces semiglobifer]